MAEANRDQNHVPVALGQSSASASVALPFKIDSSTGRLLVDSAASTGANTALSNLVAVAINTSLISDTNVTDDLGSAAIKWNNLFVATIGATGTRVTKGWFTDVESTNMYTVGGVSLSSTFLALAGGTMAGVIAMGNNKITGLGTPTADADAATKAYADSIAQSLDIKASVRVASTADIAVISALINGSTIDGVVVATGDRVLLKNQTAGAENGIYVVVASGAASRSADADVSAEVTSGMYVFVSEGTVSADMGYVLVTNDPIVLGTTVLVFTQFSGAGQITAGNGLSKSGNTLTINTAITVDKTTAQTLTNKTLTAVKITDGSFIADSLGGALLAVDALPSESTVNYFTIYNAVTTSAPRFVATGSDTNISIDLVPKGTGRLKENNANVMTVSSTDTVTGVKTFNDGSVKLTGATSGASTLKAPAIASTYVHTLPAQTTSLASSGNTTEATNTATVVAIAGQSHIHTITALASANTIGAPTIASGALTDDNTLVIRIKDNGTARALTYNAIFRASSDLALPSTTVLSKTLYLGFRYNVADTKWDLIAVLNNI